MCVNTRCYVNSTHSAADLHDVEFNSSLNPPAGNHVLALSDPEIAKEYGLAPEDEGKIWGEGDQRILDAMDVLRSLKKEGKIKRIGFSGKSRHRDIDHPLEDRLLQPTLCPLCFDLPSL